MSARAQILPRAEKAEVPTILVVEDEVLVRGVVAEHLRDGGFNVVEAANAAEAVDLLQSADPSISYSATSPCRES